MGGIVSTHSGSQRKSKGAAEPPKLRVTHYESGAPPAGFGSVVVPTVLPAVLPPPPPLVATTAGACVWLVEDLDRPGEWEKYPADICERLNAARAGGLQECLVVSKRRACTVDLQAMVQRGCGVNARQRRVKCVEAADEDQCAAIDPFFENMTEENEAGVDFTETAGDIFESSSSTRAGKIECGNADASKLPVLLRSVCLKKVAFTMTFSHDGNTLLTGSAAELMHWDVETATPLTTFNACKSRVFSALYSSDDSHVLMGGDDWKLRLFNVHMPDVKVEFKGHTNKVYGLGFFGGDKRFASGSMDQFVRYWDVETGTCLQVSKAHIGSIFALATSKNCDWFAISCGVDKLICAHDFRLAKKTVTATFTGHKSTLWTCALRGDEYQFASAGVDSTVRVWDVRKPGASVINICHHTQPVHFIEYMPYGKGILSCSRDATVRLTDTLTSNALWRAKAHLGTVFRVRYHQEKGLMATCGTDNNVNLWSYGNADKW